MYEARATRLIFLGIKSEVTVENSGEQTYLQYLTLKGRWPSKKLVVKWAQFSPLGFEFTHLCRRNPGCVHRTGPRWWSAAAPAQRLFLVAPSLIYAASSVPSACPTTHSSCEATNKASFTQCVSVGVQYCDNGDISTMFTFDIDAEQFQEIVINLRWFVWRDFMVVFTVLSPL